MNIQRERFLEMRVELLYNLSRCSLHFIFESHHGRRLHTLFNQHRSTTIKEDTQTESHHQHRYHELQIFTKPKSYSREKASNAFKCTAKPTTHVAPESFAFMNFEQFGVDP